MISNHEEELLSQIVVVIGDVELLTTSSGDHIDPGLLLGFTVAEVDEMPGLNDTLMLEVLVGTSVTTTNHILVGVSVE